MSETPMGPMEQAVDDYYLGGGNVAWSKLCGAAREADARQQRLVDALKALVEEQESNKHQHSGMGLVYLDNARKALKSVEGEAVRAD